MAKKGQKSGFLAMFGPPQNDMFQKSSEKTYEIDTKWSKSEKKSKKKCHFWVIFETPKIIIYIVDSHKCQKRGQKRGVKKVTKNPILTPF